MELSDRDLLERYATRQEDAAFRLLVERHLALVHGVARRVMGSEDLARDVAQQVFLRLAQRATLIPKDLTLTAWLHRVTHHLAIDLVRREERRKKRELATLDATAMETNPSPRWSELAPVIDHLINRLPAADREVLLLRYYKNEPHAAVARQLGLSEAAAKKRTTRALDKLRGLLAKKGIATSAAALATLLPAHAATPVSGSYVLAVSTAAKGAAPVAASSFNIHLAMTTAQKSAIAAAALIFMASAGYALRSSSPGDAAALGTHNSGAGEANGGASPRLRAGRGSPLSAEERLERLRRIIETRSQVERPRQMLAFIDDLGPDQFAETAAQLEQLKVTLHTTEFQMLLGAWVKLHPLAAVAWAKGNANKAVLASILLPWGEADPAAALDWVIRECPEAMASNPREREPLIAVLAGTASKDMVAALKGLQAIQDEKARIDATKQLGSHLSGNVAMVEEMLDTLAPETGAQYSEFLSWSSSSLMNNGKGDRALELLLANEAARQLTSLKVFFQSWHREFPEEALAAIQQIPEGDLRAEAVAGYCVAACNANPPETFELLHRYPGAATDMVLAEMGQECAIEHVALGIEQMLQIKDANLRNEVVTSRLKWWLQLREKDARKWMDAHELPAEVRDALQGPIEKPDY